MNNTIFKPKIIGFLIIVILLIVWLKAPEQTWQYLFHLRVPILGASFLVFFPLLAATAGKQVLKNVFVLNGKFQLSFVILGAIMTGMTIMLESLAVLNNSPARFGLSTPLVISEHIPYLGAFLLGIPISFLAINATSKEERGSVNVFGGAILGFIISSVLLYLSYLTRGFITDILNKDILLEKQIITFIKFFTNNNPLGYVDKGELISDHIAAMAFLFVALLVYFTILFLFIPRPKKSNQKREVPILFYVVLTTLILIRIFSGVTFYFDYYQIPIVVMFIGFIGLMYWICDVDHYFTFANKYKLDEMEGEDTEINSALKKRLQNQSNKNEKTLVIVCASGGGIQASGWAVQVLKGLQEELGNKFIQAIGFISSVSGGSVGTMYYLDRFNQTENPQNDTAQKNLDNIFNSATANSLDAVGWGLAYPDLCRVIGLPFIPELFNKLNPSMPLDRGIALEIDWQNQTANPDQTKTLLDWRKQINKGEIPIPIFNATLVEDGRRFLISPMTFVNSKTNNSNFIDFNTLYQNKDINLTTASRLSATFPYVSPISRNEGDNNNEDNKPQIFHIADGGFFDNSGVVTMVEWVDQFLHKQGNKDIGLKNILFVEINAFPKSAIKNESKGDPGFFMTTFGPLLAMYKVRDTTQISRNITTLDLLKDSWECKNTDIKIEHCSIYFPSSDEFKNNNSNQEETALFDDKGEYSPPLSWKLTSKEKNAIKTGWEIIKNKQEDNPINKIRKICERWGLFE